MSHTIPISSASVAVDPNVGLAIWMQRVLDRASRVRETWKADDIHDLRVALRRCRSMAEALSQVNPDPGWRKVRKSSRHLFRLLGDLRDTQVERSWIKKLAPPRDSVRTQLLRLLASREREQRDAARKALGQFGSKEWRKLARKLERKARLFPLESVVFRRLALAKLDEATDLFARARKTRSAIAWHRARIGLKHFRYIAENFLPHRYEARAAGVKSLQDLLGEMHDLDVLRLDVRRHSFAIDPVAVARFLERVHAERKTLFAKVMAQLSGSAPVLLAWRSGLSIGPALLAAPFLNRQSA